MTAPPGGFLRTLGGVERNYVSSGEFLKKSVAAAGADAVGSLLPRDHDLLIKQKTLSNVPGILSGASPQSCGTDIIIPILQTRKLRHKNCPGQVAEPEPGLETQTVWLDCPHS